MTNTSDAAELTEITIKRYLCRHIHTSGRRCGSPALRGEQFCYYHHTTCRPGPRYRGAHPSAYEFEMPDLDDLAGIEFALAQWPLPHRRQPDRPQARPPPPLWNQRRHPALARNLRRISTPSARHAPDSEDSSADACKQDLVEDLILDPEHGPIAPIAELTEPIDLEEARNKRFAEMLDDLIHPKDGSDSDSSPTLLSSRSEFGVPGGLARRGEGAEGSASCHSDPQPSTDILQPATLPTLHATAELPVADTLVVAHNRKPATTTCNGPSLHQHPQEKLPRISTRRSGAVAQQTHCGSGQEISVPVPVLKGGTSIPP